MQFRVLAAPLLLLLPLLLTACSGGKAQEGAPPPTQVVVAHPLQRDVQDWDDYTGRFEAVQDVEIRPRVTGQVAAIHFRNGQDVGTGQPLFTIDPRPYQAAYEQAVAQAAHDRAVLANATQVARRSRELAKAEAVSKEELEKDIAAERGAAADLLAAEAAVRNARLNLSFTVVRAPFRGRVSDRKVSLGDTVKSDETVLTRLVSIDPIWFAFEGAEAFLLKYSREDVRGERRSSRNTPNPIDIQLADESGYNWHGRMAFVDNAVDPNSGTIRARAEVANPTGFLTPGMFGRARLLGSGTYHAMLIPDEAVVTDQTRRLVYVLSRDNKVVPRPVELTAKVEGLRIVRAGLGPGEWVIIEGIGRLQPGMPVSPKRTVIRPRPEAQAAPTAPTAEPAAGQATAR